LSYQVLARKWRPQNFEEVTGQEHVTTALRNAIAMGRVPHAVLLCGPRGVGKTTIARILSRCLNCEKGPTATPCGVCSSCTEIAGGSSTDVQEIDAASRTSVDDVRELIEAVRYAPSPGKYRIFVVDEVHMLSTPAFNALLKTLEEPPPRCLFVFATTNPEKIPFTVVSRCQRYDLRRLPTAEVAARLAQVAKAEGIAVSPRSLLAIAREGDGSLRDSLTLLDQVIAMGGTEVNDDRVAEVLDLIDRRVLLGIITACVDADPAGALAACGRAAEMGIEARRLGAELLALLRDLVVLRIAPNAEGLVEGSDSELEELRQLASRADAGRLRRMFRALVREQEDLAWAPQPFAVLEMALVRLATTSAGEDVQALLGRLDALERRLAGGGSSGDDGPGGSNRGPRPAPARPSDARSTPSAPAKSASARSEQPLAVAAKPTDTEPTPVPTEARAETPDPSALLDRLRALASERDRALGAALDGVVLGDRTEASITIRTAQPFAAHRLERRRADLEAVCARLFGRPMRVTIAGPTGDARTSGAAADDEAVRQRRREALAHPAINATLEILGGEVIEIRSLGEAGGPAGTTR
jgi:DNA polymerase-3 subunit gamma/tau